VTSKVITTWRVDLDLLKAAQARAKSAGETVTDVLTRALEVYVAEDAPAPGGTPVAVPHVDFGTPTGNPQVEARKGYGLMPLTSRKRSRPKAAAREDEVPPVVFAEPGGEAVTGTPVPARTVTEGQCPPHPKARVFKGLCRACGRQVGSEKVA
jgi:hypothetical protein